MPNSNFAFRISNSQLPLSNFEFPISPWSPSCPATPTKNNATNPTAAATPCAANSSPNVDCENRIPVPKTINGNPMTGTKQLLGHFYRLLHLLRQMLNRGRPTPTNSTGKNPLPGSITGTFILQPSSFSLHLVRTLSLSKGGSTPSRL
jgi:hypothetical protein